LEAAAYWRRSREYAQATAILRNAVDTYPREMRLRAALGETYFEAGDAAAAVAFYDDSGACEYTVDDCGRAISAAIRMGDGVKADRWLRRALRRWPRDPSILILAGRHSALWGLDGDALRFWNRAAEAAGKGPAGAQSGSRAVRDWKSVSWVQAVGRQTSLGPRSTVVVYGLQAEPLLLEPQPLQNDCDPAARRTNYCLQGD
jgi:tetratricopeptide (TPR) repeat protein